MLVYKYRGDEYFERDLYSIEKNYFWAPKFDDLNDPCETLINTNPFKQQSRAFATLFGKRKSAEFENVENAAKNLFEVKKGNIGIYSLSTIYNDELLWAHYANSHKGFCIEYNLEVLLDSPKSFKTFSFPIIYNKKPPEFALRDIGKMKSEKVVQKIAGYKSLRWNYEKEFRIITDFFGEHPYNFNAVKSIYFGVKMSDSNKQKMIQTLKGRKIQFYQMYLKENSYVFEANKINDIESEELSYFQEIPKEITRKESVSFKVIEEEHYREMKAVIRLEIENEISKESIKWLANKIKEDKFRNVKRIFIFYYLKKDLKREIAWATSHYIEDDLKITINNFAF